MPFNPNKEKQVNNAAGSGIMSGSITAKVGKWLTKRLKQRGCVGDLLSGEAVVLLGNLQTARIAVMQDDYYWLVVTSWLFLQPLEAHLCRTRSGC